MGGGTEAAHTKIVVNTGSMRIQHRCTHLLQTLLVKVVADETNRAPEDEEAIQAPICDEVVGLWAKGEHKGRDGACRCEARYACHE